VADGCGAGSEVRISLGLMWRVENFHRIHSLINRVTSRSISIDISLSLSPAFAPVMKTIRIGQEFDDFLTFKVAMKDRRCPP